MAFADKMKQVKGVYGVATYVSSHKVKIYYDATILNDQMLQQELFTPRKAIIQSPGSDFNEVKIFSLMLDNFFDPSDFENLSVLLKEKTDAYGLESEFSCPVTVRIYFPGNSEWSGSKLVEILETKKIEISSGKDRSELNLSFKVVGQPILKTISGTNYYFKMFEPYNHTFNWKPNYREADVDTLVVPLHLLRYEQDSLSYLVSHLSNDGGVVGFHTTMDSLGHIIFKINYLDSLTNSANILKAMASDTLLVNYDGGETGKIVNWFKF